MMTVPLIAYPHFKFDTVEMAARKNEKRAEMQKKWQDDWADYYGIKQQDLVQSKQKLKHYNLVKDIETIKNYENLKKNLFYYMYRYNTSLGTNLDVYV
jgi:hypothetical protein